MSDTFYTKVLPILTGIGVTAAVALSGVALPILIAQGREIQKLQDQMEAVSSKMDDVQETASRLDKHMTDNESDPAKVVAQFIGTTATNRKVGVSMVIGGKLVVFPRDEVAEGDLMRAGYKAEPISPTISGYYKDVTVPAALPVDGPPQRPGR